MDEVASGSSSTTRTLMRGLVLVVLGVASHLWIDAGRRTTAPALDLAAQPAVETASVDESAAESAMLVAEVPRPEPAIGGNDGLDVVTAAIETAPTERRRTRGAREAVGTTGVTAAPAVEPGVDSDVQRARPGVAGDALTTAPVSTSERRTLELAPLRLVSGLDVPPDSAVPAIHQLDLEPVDAGLPPEPPARVAAAGHVPGIEADEQSVRLVLQQYQRAYNALDVRAASRVWPDVDRRALARAFSHLEAQSIRLEDCGVTFASAAAHATCRGEATYTPKVGGGPLRYTREWNFTLARTDSDWRIQSVH